jgi:hypothetical protein
LNDFDEAKKTKKKTKKNFVTIDCKISM